MVEMDDDPSFVNDINSNAPIDATVAAAKPAMGRQSFLFMVSIMRD